MDEIKELKYEYDNLKRVRDNLQKNYDRRKKLNLLDDDYERQANFELRKYDSDLATINRRIRSIESAELRKRNLRD
jgi:hypothetical protein